MTDRDELRTTDDALLEATSDFALTPDEADDMFATAWAARVATDAPDNVVDLGARRSWFVTNGPWLAAAAALLLALPMWWFAREQPQTDHGIKSAANRPNVALTAVVGSLQNGQPTAGRVLADASGLEAGERVLFRVKLDRPAHIALWAQPQGGDVEKLWAGAMTAGDHEVARGGQALAFDPAGYGTFTLAVTAGPPEQTATAPAALTRTVVESSCHDCGFASIQLVTQDTP